MRPLFAVVAMVWCGFVLSLNGTPGDQLPDPGFLGRIPHFDKFVHSVEYGTLAALLWLAWGWRGRTGAAIRLPRLLTVVAVGLIALIDELHQLTVAGRHGDPFDWLTDVIAASIVVWVASNRTR